MHRVTFDTTSNVNFEAANSQPFLSTSDSYSNEHQSLPQGAYQDVINTQHVNTIVDAVQSEPQSALPLLNSDYSLSLNHNADSQALSSAGLSTASNRDSLLGQTSQSLTGQGFGSTQSFGSSTSATDPNGTIRTASTAGSLTTSIQKTGRIGKQESYGRDEHDYWKFKVTNDSKVSISLTGLSADAGLAVYNQSGQLITWSNKSGKNSESIVRWLGKGDYYALAYSYSGSSTQYNLKLSQGQTLSSYFVDSSVRSATSKSLQDGIISRNEMISILRSAKDKDVTGTEIKELRNIINSSTFEMKDHVRVLGTKVVSKNRANTASGIGNLTANSHATRLEGLIGKWFLGTDRPEARSDDGKTTYRYSKVNKPLFDGISYQDIDQGDVGDCYFLAGLGAAAFRKPDVIRDMFIDNGDDTFTVRFFKNGKADYVTVDQFLPNGGRVYAKAKDELWVALAEKAYAQLNEEGWIGQDNTNSYQGISGGWSKNTIQHITGESTQSGNIVNTTKEWNFWKFRYDTKTSYEYDKIVNQFNANKMVTLWTLGDGKKLYLDSGEKIVSNHEYVMTGYNSATRKYKLYNPWGNSLEVSRSELKSYFGGWTYSNG